MNINTNLNMNLNMKFNMNGELNFKEKYRIEFVKSLKLKPDSFFKADSLHKSNGNRGSWIPSIEEPGYQSEKKLRNL